MIDVVLARTFHEMDYIPPGTPLSDETVVRLMRMFRAFLRMARGAQPSPVRAATG